MSHIIFPKHLLAIMSVEFKHQLSFHIRCYSYLNEHLSELCASDCDLLARCSCGPHCSCSVSIFRKMFSFSPRLALALAVILF